jgi:hypothetical protein
VAGCGISKGSIMNKFIVILFVCLTLVSLPVSGFHQANGFQRIVTGAQVNGTWQYRGSVFHIWSLGQQKLKVEFLGTYEYKSPKGRMANTGLGSGTATIEGDTAIFKPTEVGEDEDCKITMRFTRSRLIVNQEGICGFGHNVVATGTYRRISRAKPKFDQSAP